MTNEKKAPAYSEAHRAYLRALRRKDHFVTAMRYLLLLFCLALWELAARVGWIDPFIGSSPSRLWAAILRLYQAGELSTRHRSTAAEPLRRRSPHRKNSSFAMEKVASTMCRSAGRPR